MTKVNSSRWLGKDTVSQMRCLESLTPDALADRLPSRPLLTSPRGSWRGVELQMYRHPPGEARTPGNRDHLLVLHMAGKVLIDDTTDGHRRQRWADASHFSLTPAGVQCSRSWKGRPEVLLLHLDPALIRGVAQDLNITETALDLRPRVAVPDRVLHDFGHLLHLEAANLAWGSAFMVDSLLHALAVHLLRHHSNLSATPEVDRPLLTSRRLNRALDYMTAHLNRPISLSELATVCGLSSTHFSRAFREAMGQPPHAYLVGLRMERAIDLLEQTRLPITEVALSCGFDQPQYFATVFRRKFGLSPSAWRSKRGL